MKNATYFLKLQLFHLNSFSFGHWFCPWRSKPAPSKTKGAQEIKKSPVIPKNEVNSQNLNQKSLIGFFDSSVFYCLWIGAEVPLEKREPGQENHTRGRNWQTPLGWWNFHGTFYMWGWKDPIGQFSLDIMRAACGWSEGVNRQGVPQKLRCTRIF